MLREAEQTGDTTSSLTSMFWTADRCAQEIGRTRHALACLVWRAKKKIAKNPIPFHKPDGRLQFIPEEVRAWLTKERANVS